MFATESKKCTKCRSDHKTMDRVCWLIVVIVVASTVTYGGSDVRRRAVEIQQVKTVNIMSYADAA